MTFLYVCITTVLLTLNLLAADNNEDSEYQLEKETNTYVVESLKTKRRKRVGFLGMFLPRPRNCRLGHWTLLPGQRIRHKGKLCGDLICAEDGLLDISVCNPVLKPIHNCLKDRGDPKSFYPKCCRYLQCSIVNNEMRGVLL